MNAFDEPQPLNRDALLATIYAIQTDLKIMEEMLARQREPELSDRTILNLACLHHNLLKHTPSLTRH